MTLAQEAAELMKEAAEEIRKLRMEKAVLSVALEDLLKAFPRQNNDPNLSLVLTNAILALELK